MTRSKKTEPKPPGNSNAPPKPPNDDARRTRGRCEAIQGILTNLANSTGKQSPVATTVLVVQLDGNLRTVAAGIEPEHVDLICSGLLALVDRLRQYQSAPPTQATKADVVQMRPGFPRISNQ